MNLAGSGRAVRRCWGAQRRDRLSLAVASTRGRSLPRCSRRLLWPLWLPVLFALAR